MVNVNLYVILVEVMKKQNKGWKVCAINGSMSYPLFRCYMYLFSTDGNFEMKSEC